MIQALAKHIEQLVALPDELRETTIRKYKELCDSCGCHNARELAAGKLASLKRSWQSNKGTFSASGLAEIEPMPSESE